MKWISVKDQLPAYDEFVLWACDSGYMFVDHLDKEMSVELLVSKGLVITHWCQLPPLPKE